MTILNHFSQYAKINLGSFKTDLFLLVQTVARWMGGTYWNIDISLKKISVAGRFNDPKGVAVVCKQA